MHGKIEKMTREEVELAVNWAAEEGWNPGLHDADCFYSTDPEGFFIAKIDGVPAGSISAVSYGDKFGFIGFFIVKKEYRGHRIGVDLGLHAIASLGKRIIGVDGVLEKVREYEDAGFEFAYKNIRYECSVYPASGEIPGIVPLSSVPFKNIMAYDSKVFPAPRENFLEKWISQSDSFALASVKDGNLSGFGVIRKCRTGYKIGPLFADNSEIAEMLFLSLCSKIKDGDRIYIDVPEINLKAMSLARRYGMKEIFATARMYKNGIPDVNLNKIFGVTSFELG